MKIGVVGGGIVGRATARTWIEHVDEVRVYDLLPERSTHSCKQVMECDFVFVCLPTPQRTDGLSADVSSLSSFLGSYKGVTTPIVLKSTVPVGTTRAFRERFMVRNLLHSPEFLTARCATVDAQIPSRNVIGGHECAAKERLAELHCERFRGTPLYLCTSDESELVKLTLNAFFAVKVAFFNEARELADAVDADWDTVLKAVLADGRIAHSHTRVPGPDGKFGFGGTCLPKDAANFVSCSLSKGLTPLVAKAALYRNEKDRTR